jgi:hypothetical protein
MRQQLPALFVLGLLAFAGSAAALETDELIAISAMPLAVADVVALPDVPQNDVITVVTTLNDARVPAPQFVEIVRYVPVALVEPAEPRFVTYVTQQYETGLTGEPLAVSIAERYDTYGIDEIAIDDPPVMTIVERREILPEVVVTRFQPAEFDPLALIAMPLAVAAVADIAGVPATDLMRFVSSLNQARVPAPQFVEVVRYSPVVLVDRTDTPQFIDFLSAEIDRGLTGRPLAFSIARRIETFEPVPIDVAEPRLLVDRDEILPPVVVTRVARAHPHGGPPGQLKKDLGLQTGAEVVHGTRPDRVTRSNRVAAVRTGDGDRGDRGRRPRVVSERRATPRAIRSEDVERRAKPRVVRAERSDRPERSVRREERRQAAPAVKQRGGNERGQSRGNAGGGKPAGGGKGKGKGKGKG